MSSSELDSLIERLCRTWDIKDIDTALSLFTDDCVYEDAALDMTARGKEELRGFFEQIARDTPDFHYNITNKVLSENQAAVEYVLHGTPQKDMEGNPLQGKSFEVRGVSIMEFKDGKISRNCDYWDLGTAMRQIAPDEAKA